MRNVDREKVEKATWLCIPSVAFLFKYYEMASNRVKFRIFGSKFTRFIPNARIQFCALAFDCESSRPIPNFHILSESSRLVVKRRNVPFES